jgi:hypothetical protein
MKAILKSNKPISVKLKTAIFIVAVLTVISFYLSLKFTGDLKEAYPKLKLSEKIIAPVCMSEVVFFNDPFALKLTSADPAAVIYYTLDGSEPSLSSMVYHQPVVISHKNGESNYLSAIPSSPRWKPPIDNVFKGTVLRAIAVDGKNGKSKELIRTFFMNERSGKKYSLPVISIVVNQKDLFGFNRGIYVLGNNYMDKDNYIRKNIPLDLAWWDYPANYLMRGSDAERDAHIEFFQPDGKLGFESNVGLRIHGNATRGFAQKSLRVCFREKYGQDKLVFDLFGNNKNTVFNSFILRNSGNDWNKTMFRDGFMQSLMKDSYVDIQNYRPSVVFINGEYWGIHNIRERYDENYICNKYKLEKENVVIMKGIGDVLYGGKSEAKQFDQLLDYIKTHNLSDESSYNFVKDQIDIASFMDLVIANVYFCNNDWPNNNVKFWKSIKPFNNTDSVGKSNSRWHWMLNDTDWGFGYTGDEAYKINLLDKARKVGGVGIIFNGLLQNLDFVNQFITRFDYHLNNTFAEQRVIGSINQFQQSLDPEIEEHIQRWRGIPSYNQWLLNVNSMKMFAQKRPEYQAAQLNQYFNLKKEKQITIKNSVKNSI